MECSLETNHQNCNCTYPCERHGKCCECVSYHRQRNELPACYFSKAGEATYNRSIQYFVNCNKKP